jgi:GDP-4-dehydro-6-deoxy-D-mannose reductase
MTETVLVTGASGFAGSHLVDLLVHDHERVIGWHRPGTDPSRDSPGVVWMAVDILDSQAVRKAMADAQPAMIYHCAGAAHTAQSWLQAATTLQANVLGTHHLLEAIRAERVKIRVLVPGSALVYRPSDKPLAEDAALGPQSPYATSKLAQELLGARAVLEDELPVFLTRSFNHLGPGQDPSFSASSFARQLARIEAKLDAPVIHVGNLEARRDFTDVRDVVRAYRDIMVRGRTGRIYNVCSERASSIAEVLERLMAQVRVRVDIQTDAARMRPNDVPLVLGDARRIRDEVGWTPSISVDRTLSDLLDYWRGRARDESGPPMH